MPNQYLQWLSSKTPTAWWHDSAILSEAEDAFSNGAVGMTTNPFLINSTIKADPKTWKPLLADLPASLKGQEKAEEVMRRITTFLAGKVKKFYDQTGGKQGFVCAQTNPNKPCDEDTMLSQARRYAKWAENICIKLPCTAAGIRVFEQCAAEGINVVATVSFTTPQCLAVGEAFQRGVEKARKAGIKPGLGVAVLMVGRLDDYLRDVAQDNQSSVKESDIICAGTAAIKLAYRIFEEKGYEAVIMPAGCRGAYHIVDLAGAKMTMSIAPKIAAMLAELQPPFVEKINEDVPADVIKRLSTLKEFVKAYEPDGMAPGEFITFGSTNRTLTQFVESGWNPLEALDVSKL